MHHELHCAYGDMVPFRVLCPVRTLTLKPLVAPLHSTILLVQLHVFALRALSHCKHDKSAWVETLKRVSTHLFH